MNQTRRNVRVALGVSLGVALCLSLSHPAHASLGAGWAAQGGCSLGADSAFSVGWGWALILWFLSRKRKPSVHRETLRLVDRQRERADAGGEDV